MNLSRLTTLAGATVAATQARLPAAVRGVAIGVPVHLDRIPSEDILADGFEVDILGLFSGPAHGDAQGEENLVPPQIFLYLENIWDFAEGDIGIFNEEVRLTYLHELGHYLGWDEDDLTARGLD